MPLSLAVILLAVAVIGAAGLISFAVTTATSRVNALVREALGLLAEGQTAVVTQEQVNAEYIKQFGAPSDSQLSEADLQGAAQQTLQVLPPYVEVG